MGPTPALKADLCPGGMAGRLHVAWAASAEEVSAVSAAMPALGVGGEGLLTFLGL